VLIEALSLGTPVVATDCPSGPREILDGGRLGRLVPPGDPDALAGAMGAVLSDDRTLPPEDELAGYSVDAVADRYLELLDAPTGVPA
jgi:glycosyltransferase involved in cell wall biosynthesis